MSLLPSKKNNLNDICTMLGRRTSFIDNRYILFWSGISNRLTTFDTTKIELDDSLFLNRRNEHKLKSMVVYQEFDDRSVGYNILLYVHMKGDIIKLLEASKYKGIIPYSMKCNFANSQEFEKFINENYQSREPKYIKCRLYETIKPLSMNHDLIDMKSIVDLYEMGTTKLKEAFKDILDIKDDEHKKKIEQLESDKNKIEQLEETLNINKGIILSLENVITLLQNTNKEKDKKDK